jgi:hypothetical protein
MLARGGPSPPPSFNDKRADYRRSDRDLDQRDHAQARGQDQHHDHHHEREHDVDQQITTPEPQVPLASSALSVAASAARRGLTGSARSPGRPRSRRHAVRIERRAYWG